jgi:NAD(P)-dependent dehydrogenase (short-subunit alcohol dehydrogenase family)
VNVETAMMDEWKDKTAVVTGAASGIGRATASALAERGVAVGLVDRDRDALAAVESELTEKGLRATPVEVDLLDLASLEPQIQNLIRSLGGIDILVNAAAMTMDRLKPSDEPAEPLDVTLEVWDASMTVNLKAPLILMQLAGRAMIQRGRGGRIVNITSSSAFRAVFSQPAYGTAKAALTHLTKLMANYLAAWDINVNCVAPGITRTAATAGMDYAAHVESGPLANMFKRVSEPEDVAAAVLFLCSGGARQITAQTIHTSAGAVT